MKLLVLAVLSALGCAAQTAPSCTYLAPEVKPDDPFQFTMAFLESLSYAKSAYRPTDLPPQTDALTQLSDMIFRVKAAELDYGCAAELLGGYQKSKTLWISLGATTSILIYQKLAELNEETVILLKSMADEGADRISPGDLAEKMADLRLRKSQEWEELPKEVLSVEFALVSRVPDTKGKISSLVITAQQRKTIIQKLEKDFGPTIKGGVKEGQDAVVTTAAMFYTWLNAGWKSSDNK
jgi:hypothetical protein